MKVSGEITAPRGDGHISFTFVTRYRLLNVAVTGPAARLSPLSPAGILRLRRSGITAP